MNYTVVIVIQHYEIMKKRAATEAAIGAAHLISHCICT